MYYSLDSRDIIKELKSDVYRYIRTNMPQQSLQIITDYFGNRVCNAEFEIAIGGERIRIDLESGYFKCIEIIFNNAINEFVFETSFRSSSDKKEKVALVELYSCLIQFIEKSMNGNLSFVEFYKERYSSFAEELKNRVLTLIKKEFTYRDFDKYEKRAIVKVFKKIISESRDTGRVGRDTITNDSEHTTYFIERINIDYDDEKYCKIEEAIKTLFQYESSTSYSYSAPSSDSHSETIQYDFELSKRINLRLLDWKQRSYGVDFDLELSKFFKEVQNDFNKKAKEHSKMRIKEKSNPMYYNKIMFYLLFFDANKLKVSKFFWDYIFEFADKDFNPSSRVNEYWEKSRIISNRSQEVISGSFYENRDEINSSIQTKIKLKNFEDIVEDLMLTNNNSYLRFYDINCAFASYFQDNR